MEMGCESKNLKNCTVTAVKHQFMLSQKSGLVKAIFQWSEPGAMVTWRADFAIALLRSHRIHETLILVLLSWIPKDIFKTWTNNPTVPRMIKILIYFLLYSSLIYSEADKEDIDWRQEYVQNTQKSSKYDSSSSTSILNIFHAKFDKLSTCY